MDVKRSRRLPLLRARNLAATLAVGASLTVGLTAVAPADAAPAATVKLVQAKKKQSRAAHNKAIAKKLVKKRHWSTHQYKCLVKLWNRESHWNHKAHNPWSGAYGIPQALPGKKMRSAGKHWRTSPTVQIKWGLKYIKGRYHTPCGAWSHSKRTGWY